MTRVLCLPDDQRRKLAQWAAAAYPHEACGVLLGTCQGGETRVAEARSARNTVIERSRDRYEIDPEDYLAAESDAAARGIEVVGIWHTHPDHPARPSATDREMAWGGWSYLIIAVTSAGAGDLRAWRLGGGRDFQEEVVRS